VLFTTKQYKHLIGRHHNEYKDNKNSIKRIIKNRKIMQII